VEFEPRPQAERPGEVIRRHFLGFDHLPSRLERVVDTVQHVPYQQSGVAGDVGAARDRVEIGEIGMRDKAQCLRRGALGDRRGGKAARCRQGARASRGFQERSPVHDSPPDWNCSRFCRKKGAQS